MELSLSAVDLTKRFDHFVAVDNVSLSMQRGEIFGMLGPNGAGKTTTIRILLGLLLPTSGRGTVLGFDVASQAEQIRQHVGYVSQKFALYPDLTAAENFEFYAGVYGVPRFKLNDRRASLFRDVGLTGLEKQRASDLAGGSRQRLALACALGHEPEFLFLDEPTAGVDPTSRLALWDLIYELAGSGTSILVTTHYMDEAENCHRLAFIYQGRIIAEGTPSAMKEQLTTTAQVLEIDCAPTEAALVALRESNLFDEVALYGSTIHAMGPAAAAKISLVRSRLEASDIRVRGIAAIEPSLEDVFIARLRHADGKKG